MSLTYKEVLELVAENETLKNTIRSQSDHIKELEKKLNCDPPHISIREQSDPIAQKKKPVTYVCTRARLVVKIADFSS